MASAHESRVSVRTATAADRMAARAFISPGTPRGRASLALLDAGQGLLWAALDSGSGEEQLVGFLLATVQIAPESDEPVAYIQELLVHPAFRRRGVAMQLLDRAEHYFLDERRFTLIYLTTAAENDAALRLYRSRGYTVNQVRLSKQRTNAAQPSRPEES